MRPGSSCPHDQPIRARRRPAGRGPDAESHRIPGAWLTTVATRICLNLLGSARARRERYVGEWLSEPLPEPAEWTGGQPGKRARRDAGPVAEAGLKSVTASSGALSSRKSSKRKERS